MSELEFTWVEVLWIAALTDTINCLLCLCCDMWNWNVLFLNLKMWMDQINKWLIVNRLIYNGRRPFVFLKTLFQCCIGKQLITVSERSHSQSQFHSLNPKSLLTTACSQRYTWEGEHTNGQRREREREAGRTVSVCDVLVTHFNCVGLYFTGSISHGTNILLSTRPFCNTHTHTHTHLRAYRACATAIPIL